MDPFGLSPIDLPARLRRREPEDAPAMVFVDIDLGCVSCGYNLKTLSCQGRCSECGTPVWMSLEAFAARLAESDADPALGDRLSWALYDALSQRTQVPAGALRLVDDAITAWLQTVAPPSAESIQGDFQQVAHGVCRAVWEHGRAAFGDQVEATMRSLGLDDPRAVGQALRALVEVGRLPAELLRCQEGLEGLGTLPTAFHGPS